MKYNMSESCHADFMFCCFVIISIISMNKIQSENIESENLSELLVKAKASFFGLHATFSIHIPLQTDSTRI
jgi:hypothetical protein